MKSICIFILVFLSIFAFGQQEDPKFGQITLEELNMKSYDKDSAASALILYDFGKSKFVVNAEGDFEIEFHRHMKIKIFSKASFDLGNFNIELYKTLSLKEKLLDLKAITYNNENGQITKTKFDNDNLHVEEAKYFIYKKFVLPNIKEGSVIEVSYTITSGFLYNFRGWKFQYDYPAIISQYDYETPYVFVFRQNSRGYLNFDIHSNETFDMSYNISNFPSSGVYGQPTNNPRLKTYHNTLGITNVPAFQKESYIDCEDNYIQSIEFELSYVQFPNSRRYEFTTDWNAVNKKLIESDGLGEVLNSKGFIDDTVKFICQNLTAQADKAKAIYKYVQNRMAWNGEYSWSSDGIKKPFNNRKGSSSDINLLLTVMLRLAEINADPVVVSTRDNGMVNTYFPTASKFNSVITRAIIGQDTFLLDAINKFCPFGMLPSEDINGNGIMISKSYPEFVRMVTNYKYKKTKSYNLILEEDGKLSGVVKEVLEGYAAVDKRRELENKHDISDYIKDLEKETNGITIKNYNIVDRYEFEKPLVDTFQIELTDYLSDIGDKIIFKPLLFESLDKNPFYLIERKYPVDFNYPYTETYLFSYAIPNSFELESMPTNLSIRLPDSSVSFSIIFNFLNGKLSVVLKKNINKIQFLPEEYPDLKEIYNQLVKKSSESIILKKKN